LNPKTTTIETVNGIENLIVENGEEYLMELYLNEGVPGEFFDLRPDLPLLIHL
jgi:hypothetical protein